MAKNEPKPCPACGGAGVIIIIKDPVTGREWINECSACGGSGRA